MSAFHVLAKKWTLIDPVTIYKQYFIQLIFTEKMMIPRLICVTLCFFMLSLQGGQMIELNEKFQSLYSSQNQYNESIVLDQFIPLNSSDNTNIISMDNNGQDMVGCAEFSGLISNSALSSSPIQSAGSSDILLFGWNNSTGYWHTTLGGTAKEFCWDVKWDQNGEVVIGGYFYDTFSIGGTQLVSNGFMDSFAARYDYQTDTWTGVNSFGSIGNKNDNVRGISVLSNGSYFLLSTSNGNFDVNSTISSHTNLGDTPHCDNSGGGLSNDLVHSVCISILILVSPGFSKKIDAVGNVGSITGKDVHEVGTTGEIIIVGRFSGEVSSYDDNNSIYTFTNGDYATWESSGMNDIFVTRYDSNGKFKYFTSFGSVGTDEATSLSPYSGGFVVLATTTSTVENTAKVQIGLETWEAPVGQGGKDNLILRISTTGKILDGYTFGTVMDDSVGEVASDQDGFVYATGYLGSTILHPSNSNTTLGVFDTRSAYLAKINFTGGNQSEIVDLFVSTGSTNSDARTNSVAVSDKNHLWIGGRMSPGAQENTFFGESVGGGLVRTAFAIQLGSDFDGDKIPYRTDNCKFTANENQSNYDSDMYGDLCDDDDDDDGIIDDSDDCEFSNPLPFYSNSSTDNDGDGCYDDYEDNDDDNDGFSDLVDTTCEKAILIGPLETLA